MDYEKIRKDFYKKYSEEELQDILYKMKTEKLGNLSVISDVGVNTTPILSHWVDDLLYKAKRVNNDMSPDEALQSDECLDKIFAYIKTKPKFYTGDDISNLKAYFRNSQGSVVNATKVANFSPIAARKIYERYCPTFYATILDYSCGWMARMLGCLTSPYEYKYIGIEPNSELNKRLGEFSEWICNSLHRENNTKLYVEGSEVFHPELVNTVDLSFSSPPYFNLEIYCEGLLRLYGKYRFHLPTSYARIVPFASYPVVPIVNPICRIPINESTAYLCAGCQHQEASMDHAVAQVVVFPAP